MRTAASFNHIDIGPPPYPTDAERQLVIDFVREHGRAETPAWMTALAKRFAAYRIELTGVVVDAPQEANPS